MAVEGIDISQWQGSIDWARVRAAGKSFAWCKATEGTGFTDPTFAANDRNARAAGIVVGAYHFAQPGPLVSDGTKQADKFLAVATPQTGDLIPALDLEVPNGLTAAQMQSFVRGFATRVHDALGAWPMVYVSPSFWSKYLGNSTFAADLGCPLWVAHWGVTSPTVPAKNWGGHGWSFWQYTSSGSVPGISGRVDLDRLNPTRGLSAYQLAYQMGALDMGVTVNLAVTHDPNPYDALGTAKVNGAGKSVTLVADGSKVAVASGLDLGVVQRGAMGATQVVALNFGSPAVLAVIPLADVSYMALKAPATTDCSAAVKAATDPLNAQVATLTSANSTLTSENAALTAQAATAASDEHERIAAASGSAEAARVRAL